MNAAEALILAVVDAAGLGLLLSAIMRRWVRARRERVPLTFLAIFSLWGEGAPVDWIIDAYITRRRAGSPVSLGGLRRAWWRNRYRISNAEELALYARPPGRDA